jgi:hypothetical protein
MSSPSSFAGEAFTYLLGNVPGLLARLYLQLFTVG